MLVIHISHSQISFSTMGEPHPISPPDIILELALEADLLRDQGGPKTTQKLIKVAMKTSRTTQIWAVVEEKSSHGCRAPSAKHKEKEDDLFVSNCLAKTRMF